jgi:hypothetical protein
VDGFICQRWRFVKVDDAFSRVHDGALWNLFGTFLAALQECGRVSVICSRVARGVCDCIVKITLQSSCCEEV